MVDNCLNAKSCPFACSKEMGGCVCASTCSRWASPDYIPNIESTSTDFTGDGYTVFND